MRVIKVFFLGTILIACTNPTGNKNINITEEKLEFSERKGINSLKNPIANSQAASWSLSKVFTQPQYDTNQIDGRIVVGDFDEDGSNDDIATFYEYWSTSPDVIHVFLRDHQNNSFTYQGNNGWWVGNQWDFNNMKGRVVSGDFDNDGYNDDLAGFYFYWGSSPDKIHVWTSNGSSFSYSSYGGNAWWVGNQYDARNTSYKMVSGDFDGDGYKDDIAAVYDYYSEYDYQDDDKVHVWIGDGNHFEYEGNQGWFSLREAAGQYNSITLGERLDNKVAATDLNNDGRDDLVFLYEGNSGRNYLLKIYSTGSSFITNFNSGGGFFPYQGDMCIETGSTICESEYFVGRLLSLEDGSYNKNFAYFQANWVVGNGNSSVGYLNVQAYSHVNSSGGWIFGSRVIYSNASAHINSTASELQNKVFVGDFDNNTSGEEMGLIRQGANGAEIWIYTYQ